MKCNHCGSDMKLAVYDRGDRSGRLIILSGYNPNTEQYENLGWVMCCSKCGNLQVKQGL